MTLEGDIKLAQDIAILKQYKEALKNYCKTCATCWGHDCEWWFDCPRLKSHQEKNK